MKGRIFLVCLFLKLFCAVTFTQAQDKTGYFLGVHPQTNALNPAVSYNRTLIILNPSFSFSLANSSLTFHTLFNRGVGEQDTLLFWDFKKIEKKLRNSNSFYGDATLNLLFAGKLLQNGRYASFQVSRKYNACLTYPRSFVNLRYGNANLALNKPRTIDLDNYAVDGSIYDEYAFGLSKTYNQKLSAGVHLKLLQGKMAVKTTKFLASITTKEDFSQSVMKTDAEIKLSAPVMKEKSSGSRFEVDMTELREQTSFFYYSFRNFGAALDAGFTYQVDDRIDLSGSVNDLGFIRWGAKPQQLVSSGEYLFDGFYFSSQNIEDFDSKNYFKVYTDTIQSVFLPRESDESFGTWLNARTYLGISYRYNPKFTFTGLLKSTFYRDFLLVEATVGTVYHPRKRVAFSGSWSYSNFSLYNFGVGAVYTGPGYQVFAVTDNINAITLLDVKGMNIAFGVNWLIFQQRNDLVNSKSSFLRE